MKTEQQIINWLDIETTGLNPEYNQVTEIAIVQTEDRKYNGKKFHEFVYHKEWTVGADYIEKFGPPKNGPNAKDAGGVAFRMVEWLYANNPRKDDKSKPILGGKNLGIFDCQFLRYFAPAMKHHYQLWDIGNLYAVPSDPSPPNLSQCLKRGLLVVQQDAEDESFFIRNQFPYIHDEVKHTAFEDAMQCVELYEIWCTFGPKFRDIIDRAKREETQNKDIHSLVSSHGHRLGV